MEGWSVSKLLQVYKATGCLNIEQKRLEDENNEKENRNNEKKVEWE
jgi:hypothetical protein